MLPNLDLYFAAEQAESLVFLAFGLGAFMVSGVMLWLGRDPLFKGLAIPLVLVGAIQVGVGATVHARSESQLAALKTQFQAAPGNFKVQELARMQAVRSNFAAYKTVEVAFIVFGLLLALPGSLHRFWRGIGLGMLLQGALMLPADLVAEDRADTYIRQIESLR